MGGQRAIGIKPHLARAEQKPRIADLMHKLHLFGRDFLLDPQELLRAGKVALELLGIEIGEDQRQLLGRADRVDHQLGLGVKRMRQKVRGKDPALPVGDIGAPRRDHLPPVAGLGFHRFGRRKRPHADADCPEAQDKGQPQEQKAPLGPSRARGRASPHA